jgi:cytochrome c5
MSHHNHADAHNDGQPEDIFKSALNILIKVAIATVVVVGILITMAVVMAPEDTRQSGDMTEKAVAARIQKVGTLALGGGAGSGPRSGEDLYKGRCAGCHDAGLLGAPKLGDKAGWSARIATGYQALLTSALKGKKAMPPQGGGDYSDADVGRALVYLANASGAKFAEPKAEAAPKAK